MSAEPIVSVDAEPAQLQSYNPATGELVGSVPIADERAVQSAVTLARAAQPAWAATPLRERARVMRRCRNLILDRVDALTDLITREQGRPPVEALATEIFPAADMVTYYARRAGKMLKDQALPMHLFVQRRSYVHYEPIGVVAVISPWNFPFILPFSEVMCALLAGNAVVLKPSELTPLTGQAIADLFRDAGLPRDLLAVVQGDGQAGAALVRAGVGKISFTGSTGTAKKILALAAETLTPVTCELGGKDPLIVLDDANLDRAADAAVWGGFVNAGQVCASVERVYVARPVAERFTQKVVERTRRLRVSQGAATNETELGPMISDRQRAIVERHVSDAVARGAKVLAGGKRPDGRGGYFYEPTVLADVPQDAPAMQEETFGPVLPINVFDSEDEAVRLANASQFGLSAYVFSEDKRRANRLARRLMAGTVIVNNVIDSYGAPETPWGGVKQSGFGRVHGGANGLRDYCVAQHVMLERFRPLRRELWWFPYSPRLYRQLRGMTRALFRHGA